MVAGMIHGGELFQQTTHPGYNKQWDPGTWTKLAWEYFSVPAFTPARSRLVTSPLILWRGRRVLRSFVSPTLMILREDPEEIKIKMSRRR